MSIVGGFDQAVLRARDLGCQCVQLHLNDSRRELGSRIDRHAHIGRGRMGLDPFHWLLNDPLFREVPMYLETPKGQENGVDLDRVNLATLYELCSI